MAPVGNATTSSTRPRFTFNNAPTSGPVGTVNYTMELATDSEFDNRVAVWTVGQQDSQTSLDAPGALSYAQQYFWRVRAYDPTVIGPWSSTQAFKTPAAPVIVVTPAPGTGAPPGTSCGPMRS